MTDSHRCAVSHPSDATHNLILLPLREERAPRFPSETVTWRSEDLGGLDVETLRNYIWWDSNRGHSAIRLHNASWPNLRGILFKLFERQFHLSSLFAKYNLSQHHRAIS
jgi:hypothetical protein